MTKAIKIPKTSLPKFLFCHLGPNNNIVLGEPCNSLDEVVLKALKCEEDDDSWEVIEAFRGTFRPLSWANSNKMWNKIQKTQAALRKARA